MARSKGRLLMREGRPRPIHLHVAQALTPVQRQVVRDAFAQTQVCVWQPGFRVEREAAYRWHWWQFGPCAGGLGHLERPAFTWLNYCRWRVLRLLDEAETRPLGRCMAQQIAMWQTEAGALREWIVAANDRLVQAAVERVARGPAWREDYLQDGRAALVRAVDRFDVLQGVTFASYGYLAILRGLIRARERVQRWSAHEPGALDEQFLPRLDRLDVARLLREERKKSRPQLD